MREGSPTMVQISDCVSTVRIHEEGKNTTSVNKISINKSSLLRCEQCVFLGYLIYVYIGFLLLVFNLP